MASLSPRQRKIPKSRHFSPTGTFFQRYIYFQEEAKSFMLQQQNNAARACQAGKVWYFTSSVFQGQLVEEKPPAQEPQHPVTAFLLHT